MTDTRAIIEAYWESAEARDWKRFAQTLADDVVYDLPQTRERIRGRDAFVRFNAEYPGDWHLGVERLVASGNEAATSLRFTVGDEVMTALTFFRLDDGRIGHITDFWPEPYDQPSDRAHLAHLVERY